MFWLYRLEAIGERSIRRKMYIGARFRLKKSIQCEVSEDRG